MRRQKFYPLIVSTIVIMILLTGCVQQLPPTSTVEPPTEIVTEVPTTPTVEAEPGAPGLGDSLYPEFGNGGYDVQHYTLDLTVNDMATSDLDGVTTIEARATQNLSSFNLDFIGFDIEDITVNGQETEFTRDGQELTITLATPLIMGETFTVEVTYNGKPEPIESVAIPVPTGWVVSEGESFVLSEPDGAANFFPVNDHPLDKATYTFTVTVPKPFEVAANGVLTDTIDNGDTTTFVWGARDPMASYLVTINITDFDLETSEGPNGIPIRNYYAVGLPEGINKAFERQGEMIALYNELFDPYPFEVYGSVVVKTEMGTALEAQTLSIYGSDMIDVNDLPASEAVVAHELAHQWFGDSVSVADWRDIWLNESFATYAEGLWIEHLEGREALDEWVKDTYAYVVENRESMSPPGEPPADDLFNNGVYYWGALGLHALRLEVGDEVFFKILKTYYERYEHGNATTVDFIAVAEEVSGMELSAFFDSWLYSETVAPIPALGLEAK